MKKAVYHGIRDVRVEDIENRAPGPDDVLVKIKYCGICGSDVHEYLHGPFPRSPFGHEACGEVVEVGSEVSSLAVGDRVLAFGPGAYAEYSTAPARSLRKLDDSISWERAAVLEPLAGTAYAMERGRVKPQHTILITGAGPIGLSFLNAAKAIGVENIFMTEMSESRIAKAEELGATAVFNPVKVRVPDEIKAKTGGAGVDVAIEAVGVGASLKDCLASTRYRGTVVVHGIFTERVPLHMLGFVSREVTMIGTNSINLDRAIEWALSGKVEPEAMITSKIPLDVIRNAGFEALTTPGTSEIKILVEP
jgi:(R,R)-butanediol dehydrogenase/meso-butanediol dehydrogenase/diacetyl reductase